MHIDVRTDRCFSSQLEAFGSSSRMSSLMLDLIESRRRRLPREEPACGAFEAVVTGFKVTHPGHVSRTLP